MSKPDRLAADAARLGAGIVPTNLPTAERISRGDLAVVVSHGYDFGDGRPGEKAPRRVTMGVAVKDRACDARVRLRRFRGLRQEQIAAGVLFEADWEASGLEPRMVANLARTGAGHGGGVSNTVIDARNRMHAALRALRVGGEEVLRVVEAVVLYGATSTQAGAVRYADAARGIAHVTAVLDTGLNLLADHYRLRQMLDRTSKSDA